jgi:hypothetical protein
MLRAAAVFLALVSLPAVADTLPLPPVPPANIPVQEAAPVPNIDAQAPAAATSEGPTVAVKLYRFQDYDPSHGFTPGSQYQSSEDRKPIQTPGFSVNVPLR